MALRTIIRAITIATIAIAFALSAVAQAPRSTYDPAARQRSSKSRDSFIDFTLKRINPSDEDYGAAIADDRDLLVNETVESRYFWSNLVGVGLLGFFFILLVFQQRRLNRSGWKSAETIAGYEYALERANAQVEDVTSKYGEAIEALIRLKESALRAQPAASSNNASSNNAQPQTKQERKPPAESQPGALEPRKSIPAKSLKRNSITAPTSTESSAQITLFKADADLVSKINSLEQQLAHSKTVETEMRRQINDLGLKLQAEQEKNRSLKGA
jgi:hypothetical protein